MNDGDSAYQFGESSVRHIYGLPDGLRELFLTNATFKTVWMQSRLNGASVEETLINAVFFLAQQNQELVERMVKIVLSRGVVG